MYDEMWVTGDCSFTIRRLLCAASPSPKGEESDRLAVMTHAVRLLRPCVAQSIPWISLFRGSLFLRE